MSSETGTHRGAGSGPIAVVRGHRYRLLVKAPRDIDIQGQPRAWLDVPPKTNGDIRRSIDIDPYNFLRGRRVVGLTIAGIK